MQRFTLCQKANSAVSTSSEITEVCTNVRTRQCLRCPSVSAVYFIFLFPFLFFFIFFFKWEIKNKKTGTIMTSFIHVQKQREHENGLKAGAALSGSQEVKGFFTFEVNPMDLFCCDEVGILWHSTFAQWSLEVCQEPERHGWPGANTVPCGPWWLSCACRAGGVEHWLVVASSFNWHKASFPCFCLKYAGDVRANRGVSG